MATRAKKSRGKSRKRSGSKSRGGRAASAKSPRKSMKAASMKRGKSAKKKAAKKSTKRAAVKSRARRRSPIVRVKEVAQEVVQQATTAVAEGVETLKGFGETLVDRVTT